LLALPLADNVKARVMRADGTYERVPLARGETPRRSQAEFIGRALPEKTLRQGGAKSKYAKVKLASRPVALKK
jgi:hypothetical protein